MNRIIVTTPHIGNTLRMACIRWHTMLALVVAMLALVGGTSLVAQQWQDVVYLKNGSIIRGVIVEQVPGKSLTIKTADGNVFVFDLQEVEKMTREEPKKELRSLREKEGVVENPAVNSLYIELGGNALAYSVNYDRIYDERYVFRAGIGYFGVDNASVAIIPLTASYLFGRGASKFEIGVGMTIVTARLSGFAGISGSPALLGTGILAYRYQPMDGGFFFRGGLAPFWGSSGFYPWYSLSFGVSF